MSKNSMKIKDSYEVSTGIMYNNIVLQRNPHNYLRKIVDNYVDNVDNYLPSSDSPTFTMSPAPIVINRSPLIQFSSKKFSISSNVEK